MSDHEARIDGHIEVTNGRATTTRRAVRLDRRGPPSPLSDDPDEAIAYIYFLGSHSPASRRGRRSVNLT